MTRRPYSRHLAELVAEQAERAPAAPAVVAVDARWTWAQVDAAVDASARALRARGLAEGGTLGLLCTNRAAWLATALGAHRLGARVACFSSFARAWDLEYLLEHSQADLLVCVRSFRGRDYGETLAELDDARDVVWMDELTDPGGTLEPAPVSAADDAFVLYTSGSSARPKAIALQHYAVVENGFNIGERMGLVASDRVLVAVPLFWAYGAINALPATFGHGACLVLQEAFEPAGALELIEAERCTALYTLPNLTTALVSDPRFARARVATLRTGLTIGTEGDLRRVMDELGIEGICNVYGATETYGNCCVTPWDWPAERRVISQGPPLPGVQLRIAASGEIEVGGRYVARGHRGADGWYRSGDLGTLDDDGALRFGSRATEMIKTGGINVAPREIEEFLGLHPEVAAVAVVGVPDERLAEVPVAFVVAREGAAPAPADLLAFCRERIAAYKVPARVHVVPELPATDTGKLARRRLVELDRIAEGSAAA